MRYIGFIHKEPDSAHGVSFPDVPGCISAGDTIDEAVRNAVEALSGHIRVLEADGDPIPEPRDFDAIMKDDSLADERAGAMTTVIPCFATAARRYGSTFRSISVCSKPSTRPRASAASPDRPFSPLQRDAKSSSSSTDPAQAALPALSATAASSTAASSSATASIGL